MWISIVVLSCRLALVPFPPVCVFHRLSLYRLVHLCFICPSVLLVVLSPLVFLRLLSKTSLPFTNATLQNFLALNFLRVHSINVFNQSKVESVAFLLYVTTAMSSIKALSDVFVSASSQFVGLSNISITSTNRTTDTVHQASMPISNRCHSVMNPPIKNLIRNLPQ